MSKSITRAISEVYGLNVGVQKHVSPAVALEMGFAQHEMDFISRLAPDCWLVLRMDDFDLEVQLSFFVLCGASSQIAAPLRIRKKARGLTYMHDAEFCVSGGKPVAHCTVLLRKRRRNAVVVSFLEKDRTVRTRGIMNLGQSLLAVSLRAMMPFCAPDADVVVQAADDGSGRLLRYYQKLGMKVDGTARVDSATPMRASLAHILRTCSPSGESGAAGALSVSEDVTRKRGLKRRASDMHSIADDVCAICIEPLRADAKGAARGGHSCELTCGHWYHTGCIQSWLARSSSCPLCKRAAITSGGA